MIYNIYFIPNNSTSKNNRGHSLFDIEYYMTKTEDKRWMSEISCLPIVEGLVLFIKTKFEDKNFDYKEFIKEATEIQEIRGLLYERYNNYPKTYEESRHFHYQIFGNILAEKLKRFADRYNLYIDVD